MMVTCCVPNDIGGLWGFVASIIEEMLSKIRAPEKTLKHTTISLGKQGRKKEDVHLVKYKPLNIGSECRDLSEM